MSAAAALRSLRAAAGPNRRIGRLFMAGSACFAIASLPWASSLSGDAVSLIYFAGSIFFTAAAAEQYRGVDAGDRLDLLASGIQLAGTIAFNVSTFVAVDAHLDRHSTNLLVWSPDVIGSSAFLVASALALAAVHRAGQPRAHRIARLNMIGSIAFAVSAIAAYVVPDTGEALNAAAASSWTLAGALCFLVAAFMLVPRAGIGRGG
jgi:hypothetical protein